MATLIPALQTRLRHMTPGERRFAERLESKLEDDYRIWYDVPVGASAVHPDFLILHPRRGLLVLEVKDWKLSTLKEVNTTAFTLLTDSGVVVQDNPMEQARRYACHIVDVLKRDPLLAQDEAEQRPGYLRFPWGHGVVLTRITRQQFDKEGLGRVLSEHRVICQDEMFEDVDAEAFQTRLWAMFPWVMRGALTMPEIDQIRYHLYPEIRIGQQMELYSPEEVIPDVIRIMDLQQEQLARSLGGGHRVIHGVAGSGKTMILAYRCMHLAHSTKKPLLVLCYNTPLAGRLTTLMRERGLGQQVAVRSFHAWCRDQLQTYHVPLPRSGGEMSAFSEALVERMIAAIDRGQIPAGQYGAVLIDEGHDFESHWLKLAVQMVDPETNSLLVLYDDAQSIYGRRKRGKFSFKSVGIQAQGRTTLLKVNYRNTAEVIDLAYAFAKDVLTPSDADEDGVPLVRPESAARHGMKPEIVNLPSLSAEVRFVAEHFQKLHTEGTSWRDMAIVYRSHFIGNAAAECLREAGIPITLLSGNAKERRADLGEDSVKAITFHSSKGLEFPVVAIPGVGFLPRDGADIEEEVRLMYVGMTRAMERLVVTYHKHSAFVERLMVARAGG